MDTKTLVPFDVVHINHQRILDLFHKGTVEDICKEIELHYMVVPHVLYENQKKKEKGTEGMVKFIGKRLAYAVLTLFLITTATFFLVAGAPGDPIAAKVGQMPEQAQQIIREKYGLDQPVVKRYTTYMKNLLTTGDFGESIIYTGQSANDIIKNNTLVSAKIGCWDYSSRQRLVYVSEW